MTWCSKDCLVSFKKGIKKLDSSIKEYPLPWYLEEYYEYAKEEVKNFINDIKILNSKNSYYSGKIYGNPWALPHTEDVGLLCNKKGFKVYAFLFFS